MSPHWLAGNTRQHLPLPGGGAGYPWQLHLPSEGSLAHAGTPLTPTSQSTAAVGGLVGERFSRGWGRSLGKCGWGPASSLGSCTPSRVHRGRDGDLGLLQRTSAPRPHPRQESHPCAAGRGGPREPPSGVKSWQVGVPLGPCPSVPSMWIWGLNVKQPFMQRCWCGLLS